MSPHRLHPTLQDSACFPSYAQLVRLEAEDDERGESGHPSVLLEYQERIAGLEEEVGCPPRLMCCLSRRE